MNQAIVLEAIRREKTIPFAELCTQLQLSDDEMRLIVDKLVARNLVQVQDDVCHFYETGHLVIGIDIGGTKIYSAISTLGGNVVYEQTIRNHNTKSEATYTLLTNLIDTLQENAPPDIPILGIGIGAPGAVIQPAGVVKLAPNIQWWDFPLKDRLSQQYDYPIIIENDVNLATLGEYGFGTETRTENMVLFSIGTGVGAGLILHGELYRGSKGIAGEVGYMLPSIQFLGHQYDDLGALEGIVSGSGIRERAQNSQLQNPNISAEETFLAAQAGEKWAQQLVDETIDHLALCIANICVILDPDLIVFSGGVSNSTDTLIPSITERLTGTIPRIPTLRVSSLGTKATIFGTIVGVLQDT